MATLIRGDGRQVTAYQDAIGFDFAFRGKTGIIKGIGQDCKVSVVGNQATIGSGMAVIQGRQIMFDGLDKVGLPQYQGTYIYSRIYAELDMAVFTNSQQGKITIKHIDSTTGIPKVPLGDNLMKVPTGKANLDLGAIVTSQVNDYFIFPDGKEEKTKYSKYISANDLIKINEIEPIKAINIEGKFKPTQIEGIYSEQILNTINIPMYASELREGKNQTINNEENTVEFVADFTYLFTNQNGEQEKKHATAVQIYVKAYRTSRYYTDAGILPFDAGYGIDIQLELEDCRIIAYDNFYENGDGMIQIKNKKESSYLIAFNIQYRLIY